MKSLGNAKHQPMTQNVASVPTRITVIHTTIGFFSALEEGKKKSEEYKLFRRCC